MQADQTIILLGPRSLPPLAVTQLQTQKSKTPKLSSPSKLSQWMIEWITDWWGAELICWAIAAVSLAAIVIILESHKNEPLARWSFGITLNTRTQLVILRWFMYLNTALNKSQ